MILLRPPRPTTILKGTLNWVDERTGLVKIAQHPVPEEKGWRAWLYVLGIATATAFLVAVVSGIPIASIYIPSTGQAYDSIKWLDHTAVLGLQLRGLHNISGTAMFVLLGIHMCRVFLTGSFKFPRELNWLIGVVLLILTFFIMFTGQILRWDNIGVWTLQITASMTSRTPIIGHWLAYFLLGGPNFGGHSLSRMFTYHVFLLPGLLFAFIGLHIYLVLKNGISESPRAGRPVDPRTYRAWYENLLQREGVPYWPDAAWREAVFATFAVLVIIAITIIVGPPPLADPPNPANLIVLPRPDWYFMWYYAALALMPYTVENYAIIGAPVIFLAIMFLLPFIANKGERTPVRRPWAVAAVVLGFIMIASLTNTGNVAPWSPNFNVGTQPIPASITSGLSGQTLQGAKLWRQHGCAFCHQINGYGGIRGPDLSNVGNMLTPDQMTIRILNGGDNMPAFGGIISPTDVNTIVAFLQTRRQGAYAAGLGTRQLFGSSGIKKPSLKHPHKVKK